MANVTDVGGGQAWGQIFLGSCFFQWWRPVTMCDLGTTLWFRFSNSKSPSRISTVKNTNRTVITWESHAKTSRVSSVFSVEFLELQIGKLSQGCLVTCPKGLRGHSVLKLESKPCPCIFTFGGNLGDSCSMHPLYKLLRVSVTLWTAFPSFSWDCAFLE